MVTPMWIDDGTGPVRNPSLTDEEYAAGLERMRQGNLAALWQAAHDYEYGYISGSAVGIVTLGVLGAKPKCLAVQAWIKSVWDLYYARKPAVAWQSDPNLLDFSACGDMPHSVPDLIAEVMGG